MAGQRLTDKTALEQQAGSGDLLMVVDVSDTTGSAAGTSKKIDFKYVIQTDKITVTNAEVADLHNTPRTLVGALSGYWINPINVMMNVIYGAPTEGSNKNLIFGYDNASTASSVNWSYETRFYGTLTTDRAYVFTGVSGNRLDDGQGAPFNKPFIMYSSGAFDGGWSAEVYVTYAYVKTL